MAKETFVQKESEWVKKGGAVSNMGPYEEACKRFSWSRVEKQFDWSKNGKVNIVHEMIDRHCVGAKKNQVALFFWDGEKREEKYTFLDLKRGSAKFANVLKKHHVGKGDRVALFLPRTPELYIAILGVLRRGAIPVPLFEAFMDEAVYDRLTDSGSVAIVTSNALVGRIPFDKTPKLKHLFLVGERVEIPSLEVHLFHEEMVLAKDEAEPVWLDLDDGLVIHYTSGSTGKAKGVLHRQYAMVGHYQTTLWTLDLKEDDIYWCTADPGWVTGTSYGIFGPWLLGVSTVVLGGRFHAKMWYDTIERYRVSVWYSAPTAFRYLMKQGKELAKESDLSSLRHICSVGEPLNPEALKFIRSITGIAPHETWWMTETGMQLICNYPGEDFKLGATGKPFPGTYATVVDEKGHEVPPNTLGQLVVKVGWPSMMKAIWQNRAKYEEYFRLKGWYLSGDTAYKDEDGFIWYAGRADDVIKTQGERVGPFEVESALIHHPAVAEAAVIGKPDPLRGEIVKAFVTLRPPFLPSEKLADEIIQFVKKHLFAHAAPKEITFIENIPKTRSGKIMRRVLRAQELGENVGDISTMES